MIARDPPAAARSRHDLIVVGGGIYGATLALEAARRGLRPLLLERGDFGGATSWNSLRIVHGGLRYLQTLDLRRFRESVAERRWLLATFPELVHPLACLMPLYGEGARRPFVLRLAFLANDLLGRDRNRGVATERRLPRGRVLGVGETEALFPRVDRVGLRGGALWHDASMPDSQRLLVEMLRWACAMGATTLNYVEAVELLVEKGGDGRVAGLAARDLESGQTFEFPASVVVNAAGPWCRSLAARFDRDVPALFRASLAFNLLLDRPPLSGAALAVTPKRPGARTYFLHPWKGRVLAGTVHAPWSGSADDPRPTESQVVSFLADLNAAVPGLDLVEADVLRVHAGLLPAVEEGTDRLTVREVVLDHGAAGGPPGLFSVSGVKYTTARAVAEKALRVVQTSRHRPLPAPDPAAVRPQPRAPLNAADFLELLEQDREAAAGHVRTLVREEAVLRPDDLLLRRTDWGMDPRLGERIGTEVRELLADAGVSGGNGSPTTGSSAASHRT